MLLLAVFAILIYACSDDDSPQVNNDDEEKTLDPKIDFDPTTLNFDSVALDSSASIEYRIQAQDIFQTLSLEVSGNGFTIAVKGEQSFSSSLSLDSADLLSPVDIVVQFSPDTTQAYVANIVHTSASLSGSPVVTLSGVGFKEEEEDEKTSTATRLFTEDFEYTGSIVPSGPKFDSGEENAQADGWIEIRSDSRDIKLQTSGLTFPGYSETGVGGAAFLKRDGNGEVDDTDATTEQVYAQKILQQQDDTTTGTYYLSYILKVENTPTGTAVNNGGKPISDNVPCFFTSYNKGNGLWFASAPMIERDVNQTDSLAVFGIRYGQNKWFSDLAAEEGKTYLVVLKHEIITAIPQENQTGDLECIASLYVIEEGDTFGPDNEPTPLMVENVPNRYWIRGVAISQLRANGAYSVDAIRVSDQWSGLF